MKSPTLLLAICLPFSASFAQKRVAGKIQDHTDGSFLAGVTIRNLQHPEITASSDTAGWYSISVRKKDSVLFTLPGYEPRTLVFTGENEAWFEIVLFDVKSVKLDTVEVAQEMTAFEKSYREHQRLYSEALNYKPPKTKLPRRKDRKAGQPLTIEAPLSGLLGKSSGDYKRSRSFKKMYASAEARSFIEQRYDTTLVTALTGLSGDSLYRFMQAYPMSLDFADQATDIELKMWIRYNYREWMKLP